LSAEAARARSDASWFVPKPISPMVPAWMAARRERNPRRGWRGAFGSSRSEFIAADGNGAQAGV